MKHRYHYIQKYVYLYVKLESTNTLPRNSDLYWYIHQISQALTTSDYYKGSKLNKYEEW